MAYQSRPEEKEEAMKLIVPPKGTVVARLHEELPIVPYYLAQVAIAVANDSHSVNFVVECEEADLVALGDPGSPTAIDVTIYGEERNFRDGWLRRK